MKTHIFSFLVAGLFIVGCHARKKETKRKEAMPESITFSRQYFGQTTAGDSVYKFVFNTPEGMEIGILNYGGIVTNLKVPDRTGRVEDVVLGFDSLKGYMTKSPYFGAIVGRYGNRIAKGKFTLDDREYTLAINNGQNHLHGGLVGFDKKIWQAEVEIANDNGILRLHYVSKDMEEGYPGNLEVTVTYTIKPTNEVQIDYVATTDKPTVVNLTNHSYFNLSGNTKRDVLDQLVMINADQIVPVDAGLIPTGALQAVQGTPFDFRQLTAVGARINDQDEQLQLGGGYDHCWVLNHKAANSLDWLIKAKDVSNGRVFEMATTEPGVQFYSGNFLNDSIMGKYGVRYQKRYGMCFESEHYPDSPNQPDFPSVVLRPGEVYKTTTVWRFSAE